MSLRAFFLQLLIFVGLVMAKSSSGQLPEFSPPVPIPQSEIVQGRNLTRYDAGGEFLAALSHPITREQMEKLRNFISEHWKNHRRGYVRVNFVGVDNFEQRGSGSELIIDTRRRPEMKFVAGQLTTVSIISSDPEPFPSIFWL